MHKNPPTYSTIWQLETLFHRREKSTTGSGMMMWDLKKKGSYAYPPDNIIVY